MSEIIAWGCIVLIVLVGVVLPIVFIEALDRDNPSNPDMW